MGFQAQPLHLQRDAAPAGEGIEQGRRVAVRGTFESDHAPFRIMSSSVVASQVDQGAR